MRVTPYLFHLACAIVLFALPTAGAMGADGGGSVRIRGILVAASNKPGSSDPRLSQFEPKLRQLLPFKSYRLMGEGAAQVAASGNGQVTLGAGHQLELTNQGSADGGVRVRLLWREGGRTVMDSVLVLRRGIPAVLGGPKKGDETLAILVVVS